jgi:GxxExxY protein
VRQGENEERRLWACSERVIGALIEVHRQLGPGLLESAYEACLCRELVVRNVPFARQRPLPLMYKGIQLECGYRVDLIVEECVLVELKPWTRCSRSTSPR